MEFYKYTGAGNDFILINNYNGELPDLSEKQISFLCNRRFGIGADGIMILKKHPDFDFEMEYFNSDGSGGTMCGNGGRCIVAFARKTGFINDYAKFIASDGIHEAYILNDNIVKLKIIDVKKIEKISNDYTCYTGSPHYIRFCSNIGSSNVYEEGQKVRFSDKFKNEGINVNFIEILRDNVLKIRTYERGVENETLACGTGAVASALTYAEINNLKSGEIILNAKGGRLVVNFEKKNNGFENIWLSGPADFVFKGIINPPVNI